MGDREADMKYTDHVLQIKTCPSFMGVFSVVKIEGKNEGFLGINQQKIYKNKLVR